MAVSVIIPVYNAAPYLGRCIQSVCSQSYEDLQIVLVDDGSTDESPQICADAAAHDTRIECIAQANAGPAAARNTGLSHARGSWVMFVDSDDQIENDYIEHMLITGVRTGAHIVASDYLCASGNGTHHEGEFTPSRLYTSRSELFSEMLERRLPWTMWAKLIRRSALEGIRFDERLYVGEDLDLFARMIAREGVVLATSSSVGYHYNVASSSLHSCFDERHVAQLAVLDRVVRLVRENDIATTMPPEWFYAELLLEYAHAAHVPGRGSRRFGEQFRKALGLYYDEVLLNEDVPASFKLRLRAFVLALALGNALPRRVVISNRTRA